MLGRVRTTLVALAAAGMLTGCASPAAQTVSDALSATRTVRLATELEGEDLMWSPTLTVTLQDAADTLADASRQLDSDSTSSETQRDAVRDAVDAVRLTQDGDAAAAASLDSAIARLEALE